MKKMMTCSTPKQVILKCHAQVAQLVEQLHGKLNCLLVEKSVNETRITVKGLIQGQDRGEQSPERLTRAAKSQIRDTPNIQSNPLISICEIEVEMKE